jgi:hypothetical protein
MHGASGIDDLQGSVVAGGADSELNTYLLRVENMDGQVTAINIVVLLDE